MCAGGCCGLRTKVARENRKNFFCLTICQLLTSIGVNPRVGCDISRTVPASQRSYRTRIDDGHAHFSLTQQSYFHLYSTLANIDRRRAAPAPPLPPSPSCIQWQIDRIFVSKKGSDVRTAHHYYGLLPFLFLRAAH